MYGSSKKIMNNPKPSKKNNPKKEVKNKEISPAMMKRLKEHSKSHKGGMSSKHIKNMMKFLKKGDSFSKAHQKAVELDKK